MSKVPIIMFYYDHTFSHHVTDWIEYNWYSGLSYPEWALIVPEEFLNA